MKEPDNIAAGPSRPYYWLIVNHNRTASIRALRAALSTSGEEKALAVFSSEGEARTYLRLRTTREAGWRVRQTSPGELISILCGPCGDVERVALDPVAEPGGEVLGGLLSLKRERFVRTFLLTDEALSPGRRAPRPLASPRRGEASRGAATVGAVIAGVA